MRRKSVCRPQDVTRSDRVLAVSAYIEASGRDEIRFDEIRAAVPGASDGDIDEAAQVIGWAVPPVPPTARDDDA